MGIIFLLMPSSVFFYDDILDDQLNNYCRAIISLTIVPSVVISDSSDNLTDDVPAYRSHASINEQLFLQA